MALIRSIALGLLVPTLLAACGSSGAHSSSTRTSAAVTAAPFSWLQPGPAPAGWPLARLPGGATLAYPGSWHRIRSDPGTVSAARVDPASDVIDDYLNVTPRQGDETLQNWARFRPEHNGDEGDSRVQVLAAARDLRFRDGRGSCVIDRYRTVRAGYQEIACLVSTPHGANVIVAAALSSRWAKDAPALERAVSAFVA